MILTCLVLKTYSYWFKIYFVDVIANLCYPVHYYCIYFSLGSSPNNGGADITKVNWDFSIPYSCSILMVCTIRVCYKIRVWYRTYRYTCMQLANFYYLKYMHIGINVVHAYSYSIASSYVAISGSWLFSQSANITF